MANVQKLDYAGSLLSTVMETLETMGTPTFASPPPSNPPPPIVFEERKEEEYFFLTPWISDDTKARIFNTPSKCIVYEKKEAILLSSEKLTLFRSAKSTRKKLGVAKKGEGGGGKKSLKYI